MYDRATVMDANISAFFSENDWRINVTENSVPFRGVAFTIFSSQILKMYL